MQRFKCPWAHCGKSFKRKSDLCRHHRIHTNERPYHCTVKGCNKRFVQRSALTVHFRTHTGERPHACDFAGCDKAFSDSSSLARHRRTHTGTKLYTCLEKGCNRSFSRRETLANHQHRHHPPKISHPMHSPYQLFPPHSMTQLSSICNIVSPNYAFYLQHGLPASYAALQPDPPPPSILPVMAMDELQYCQSGMQPQYAQSDWGFGMPEWYRSLGVYGPESDRVDMCYQFCG